MCYNVMGDNGERRVFTIPINGLTKEEAEKQLKELISDYKSDIDVDYFLPMSKNENFVDPMTKKSWFAKLIQSLSRYTIRYKELN